MPSCWNALVKKRGYKRPFYPKDATRKILGGSDAIGEKNAFSFEANIENIGNI